MAPPTIHLIENLSTKDIEKLTQALCLPPGRLPTQVWLNEQASQIPNLPSRLRSPKSALLRFGLSMNVGPDRATLCRAHKGLNPYIIRRIFLQVTAECTTHLTRLANNQFINPTIADHIKRLQIVNSLWMDAKLYSRTYHVKHQDIRFTRFTSDCEACILAAVGGNHITLCDLRASMLGRKKKNAKQPRLLRLVEQWAKGTRFGPQITADSDALLKHVRSCRKQMQLARRQRRRDQEEGIPQQDPNLFEDDPLFLRSVSDNRTLVAEDGSEIRRPNVAEEDDHVYELPDDSWGEDEDEESDPEDDIINHYARTITSSAPLLRRASAREDIHPAFRNSMISGALGSRPATPRAPPSTSTSYASVTSVGPDRLSAENLRRLDLDRLSAENLQRLNDLPPRADRPQNRSTYMDSMESLRNSQFQPSALVSPLRPYPQQPRVSAYSESRYGGTDIYGRRPGDARSGITQYVRRADGEQARAYADLMRRREEQYGDEGNPWNLNENDGEREEYVAPPVPLRSPRREEARGNFARRASRHQDGW
ncbi:uncharacterized protein PAC_04374 [Phialocephala subalpina]|uniref:Uncharacterized protein n=1 Tax=Phialocephala subalpina TaxID=576137 RepID=A0A1L7WNY9_9HELO|nr:uncharacterized protein PAC_04374 [Phialocephala subalpina]